MRPGRGAAGRRQRGYTFVAVLALVAVASLGLAVAGPRWADSAQREREQELLRVGALYALAIAAYRDHSPGTAKQLPQSLDDLAFDTRFVTITRHLRKLYPDPLEPTRPWGLIRNTEGRIMGVYSQSQQVPLARGEQRVGSVRLAAAARYADWKFTVLTPTP